MENVLLYSKLSSLPDNLKLEVSAFIDSLLKKNNENIKLKPRFGSSKGKFKLNKNFDDPISEFNDYI